MSNALIQHQVDLSAMSLVIAATASYNLAMLAILNNACTISGYRIQHGYANHRATVLPWLISGLCIDDNAVYRPCCQTLIALLTSTLERVRRLYSNTQPYSQGANT